MGSYRVQKTSNSKIALQQGERKLEPMKSKSPLGQIGRLGAGTSATIKDLNERFGTDFTQEDRVFIEQLEARLPDDTA